MKKTIIIYLLLLLSSVVLCQTEKQIVPSDIKQQTIVTEPVTLRKGFFRTGVLVNYRVVDKYFNDKGKKEYYVNSSWGSKSAYGITLQYGVNDRLQIDMITEYRNTLQESQSTEVLAVVGSNTSTVTTTKQKGIGLGDSHFALKYQIIKEAENKFSLLGSLNLTVPTGEKNPTLNKETNQYNLPIGDGTYALGINLSARKIAYPYSFTGFIGYTYGFKGTKIINTGDLIEKRFSPGNSFETGLSANLHLNEWIVLANELNFYSKEKGRIENVISSSMPASWTVSYEPRLVFQIHRFRAGESVRIPLKGKNNVPADPLYILMAQYLF